MSGGTLDAPPITERLGAGLERAARAVDSGDAAALLSRWVMVTTKLAESMTSPGG